MACNCKCSCQSSVMRANEFEKIKYYLRLVISNSNELIQSNKLVQQDCDDLQLLRRVFMTLDKIESQYYFDKIYVNGSTQTGSVCIEVENVLPPIPNIDDVDLTSMINYLEDDETKAATETITYLDNHLNHQLAMKIRTLQNEVVAMQNQLTLDLLSTNPASYYKLNDELRDKQQSIANAYKQLGY